MNYYLLRWACVVAALILSAIWLLSAAGAIGHIPAWIPAAGLFALVLAVILPPPLWPRYRTTAAAPARPPAQT